MFDSIDTFCVSELWYIYYSGLTFLLMYFLKRISELCLSLRCFKLASEFFSQSLNSCKGCIFQLIINIGIWSLLICFLSVHNRMCNSYLIAYYQMFKNIWTNLFLTVRNFVLFHFNSLGPISLSPQKFILTKYIVQIFYWSHFHTSHYHTKIDQITRL